MEIEILDVRNTAGLADFYALPDAVYAGDAYYIKPFAGSVKDSVWRSAYADRQQLFLARTNGQPAARIVARVCGQLTDTSGAPYGMLGFFEAHNRPEPVQALLAAAVQWLRRQGCGPIIGPMDGDTWHKYRFNQGPFTKPPFMMEPYNPPYYPELWKAAGFVELASYYSKTVEGIPEILPSMEKYYRRVSRSGVTFRSFDRARFDDELNLLYELSVSIFAGNYLYTPIAAADFKSLYAGAKTMTHPRLIWFALAPEGTPIGFVFSVPDYADALRGMNGKRGLAAKLRFLMRRRTADTLNIKTMGVVPGQRGTGLGAALMYKAYQGGVELGFQKANLCLVKEGNPSGRFDAGRGQIFRKYALYHYV